MVYEGNEEIHSNDTRQHVFPYNYPRNVLSYSCNSLTMLWGHQIGKIIYRKIKLKAIRYYVKFSRISSKSFVHIW